jgi:dynein heavy chain
MKPLGAWTRDLVARVEQLSKWAVTAHAPTIFWMSGFTFPTGFLTAVLQTSARQNNVSHSQKQIFKRNEIVFESINTKYIL